MLPIVSRALRAFAVKAFDLILQYTGLGASPSSYRSIISSTSTASILEISNISELRGKKKAYEFKCSESNNIKSSRLRTNTGSTHSFLRNLECVSSFENRKYSLLSYDGGINDAQLDTNMTVASKYRVLSFMNIFIRLSDRSSKTLYQESISLHQCCLHGTDMLHVTLNVREYCLHLPLSKRLGYEPSKPKKFPLQFQY